MWICIPRKGIVNILDKLEIANGITSQSRTKVCSKAPELAKILTKLNPGDVVDDVQESYACTCIVGSLFCFSDFLSVELLLNTRPLT